MMVTGSNLRRTKCRTRAEWAQIDAADAASVRQFRDRQSGVLTSQQ